jgi:hypothetical protein
LVGLEPIKTLTTLIGCVLLRTLPDRSFSALMRFAKPSMASGTA